MVAYSLLLTQQSNTILTDCFSCICFTRRVSAGKWEKRDSLMRLVRALVQLAVKSFYCNFTDFNEYAMGVECPFLIWVPVRKTDLKYVRWNAKSARLASIFYPLLSQNAVRKKVYSVASHAVIPKRRRREVLSYFSACCYQERRRREASTFNVTSTVILKRWGREGCSHLFASCYSKTSKARDWLLFLCFLLFANAESMRTIFVPPSANSLKRRRLESWFSFHYLLLFRSAESLRLSPLLCTVL